MPPADDSPTEGDRPGGLRLSEGEHKKPDTPRVRFLSAQIQLFTRLLGLDQQAFCLFGPLRVQGLQRVGLI